MRTHQQQIVGKESSKWKPTQRALWLQSLKSILELPIRPSPERVVLPVSLSSSIFHPSIINPPHTPPTDLVGSPVFVRRALRELCASVCVYVSLWVSEWVCVSGLLISLGCCRFKLFIPTAPAHTHSHTCTSPSHACPHPPAREAVSVATLSKIADFSSRNEIKGEIGCISIRGGSLELNTHPWSRPLRFSFVFLTLPPPPTHSSYLACLIVLSLFFYIYLFFNSVPPFLSLFVPPWLGGGRENETKKEIDLVWMTFDPFRASKQYVVTWETGHGDVRGDCLTGDLISCGTGGSFPAFCEGLFWQTLSGP